jgi:hypothetical protein
MKYRKDIHLWLAMRMNNASKWYKVYQHTNGLLYCANYFYEDKNRISHYSYFSVWGINDQLKKEVEDHFNLSFAKQEDDIICRCGEKKFTASYGDYKLNLECVVCLNKFTAYSG